MKPKAFKLKIELQESTFFASHELHDLYFTEALIGNYALAYALGLAASPYDRTHVGYAEDLPELNQKGIYVTPAWLNGKPRFRIERFNCQSESFYKGMIPNAVVELAGRQYLNQESRQVVKYMLDGQEGKRITATNRPQTGILKMLSPLNCFTGHLIAPEDIFIPQYIRLGKFMSKAKVQHYKLKLWEKKRLCDIYPLVNPLDLHPDSQIYFGDSINIHPTPLIRRAEIKGTWWIDRHGKSLFPAGMAFRGF